MIAYVAFQLRAVVRSPAFLAWACLSALLLLAGVFLDALALEPEGRRLAWMGGTAVEVAAWGAAVFQMASLRGHAGWEQEFPEVVHATKLGRGGMAASHLVGSSLAGLAAAVPCIATVLVLAHYIVDYDCVTQLITASVSAVAGGMLLAAWVLLLAPVAGGAGATIGALLAWTVGGWALPPALAFLAPHGVATGGAADTACALGTAGVAALAAAGLLGTSLALGGGRRLAADPGGRVGTDGDGA